MLKKHLSKKPDLKKCSLSSLNDQIISEWSGSSRSVSPIRKKRRVKSQGDFKEIFGSLSDQGKVRTEVERHGDVSLNGVCDRDVDTDLPWYWKHAPRRLEQVAIHKRKLKDVREALQGMLENPGSTRILLLTGPSGCSKSTVIEHLANLLVPLYRTRTVGNSFLGPTGNVESCITQYSNDTIINGVPGKDNFSQFLAQAKYRIGRNLSLILVEDMPNLFHTDTRNLFQRALLEWLYSSEEVLPPLVICLTECEIETSDSRADSFSIDNVFSAEVVLNREILNHPRLKRIRFNPINATLMKGVLNNVALREANVLKANDKWGQRMEVIQALTRETGDIRSALTKFEFWAKSKYYSPHLYSNDESISFFHAIGKVIYGSQKAEHDSEVIDTLFATSGRLVANSTFKLGLLENYTVFNKGNFPISTASKILEGLSASDVTRMSPESLDFAIRNTRHSFSTLRGGVSYNHGKMYFPVVWKMRGLQREFMIQAQDYFNVSLYKYNSVHLYRDIVETYGYYAPLIRNRRKYRLQAIEHYMRTLPVQKQVQSRVPASEGLSTDVDIDVEIDIFSRIGGSITSLASDSTIVATEDNESEIKRSVAKLKKEMELKLEKLVNLRENQELEKFGEPLDNEESEEYALLDDPIVESGTSDNEDTEVGDDDDDDSLYEILSQRAPRNLQPPDESLSDPDLESL